MRTARAAKGPVRLAQGGYSNSGRVDQKGRRMKARCRKCGHQAEGRTYCVRYGTLEKADHRTTITKETYRIHGVACAFICTLCAKGYDNRRRSEAWLGGPIALGLLWGFGELYNRGRSDLAWVGALVASSLGFLVMIRAFLYSEDRVGALENLAWRLCRRELLARFGTSMWRNPWRSHPIEYWNSSAFAHMRPTSIDDEE